MAVGDRIKERREKLGLTQDELAAELGITHQHISRVELGHSSPSLDLIVRVAQRFGVTCDYLLTGDDRPAIDLIGAIRADPSLSASAKKHLIGLVEELH